jgi:hypothetical protein
MKCTLAHCMIVACTLLGSGEANSAPRGPSMRGYEAMKATRPTESPEIKQADLESWLARLQGNFTIKLVLKGRFTCLKPAGAGTIHMQPCMTEEAAKGITFYSTANCDGIGEGPGLYCTFDALRRPADNSSGESGALQLASLLNDPLPIRALFGIDPATLKISMMTMNSASVVLSAMGSPQGNTATFDGTCNSALAKNMPPCKWSLQVEVSADGRSVVMKRTMHGDTYTFELNRVD